MSLSPKTFWAIIALAQGSKSDEEYLAILRAALTTLPPQMLMGFDTMFRERREQAHRPMHQYLIEQLEYGTFGDAWEDFLTWFVCCGEGVFYECINNPRRVLKYLPDRSTALPGFEQAAYVAAEEFERKTGSFEMNGTTVNGTPETSGKPVVWMEVLVSGVRGNWTIYLIRHDRDGLSCLDFLGDRSFTHRTEADRKAHELRAAYCEEKGEIRLDVEITQDVPVMYHGTVTDIRVIESTIQVGIVRLGEASYFVQQLEPNVWVGVYPDLTTIAEVVAAVLTRNATNPRVFELVSTYADDPERGGRHYLTLDEIRGGWPTLLPLVEPTEFVKLEYIVGLHSIVVTECECG